MSDVWQCAVLQKHISLIPVCSYYHYVNVFLPCFTGRCVRTCVYCYVHVCQGGRGGDSEINGEHKQPVTHDSSVIAIIMEQYGEGHYLVHSKKKEWTIISGRGDPQVCCLYLEAVT